MKLPRHAAASAALLFLSVHAAAQCRVDKILAPDAVVHDEAGFSVAVDGDWGLVGARLKHVDGHLDVGVAYVVRHDDGGTPFTVRDDAWVSHQVLVTSGASDFDHVGWAVALRGDVALVGAPNEGELFDELGAVYVFARDDAGTPGDPTDDVWTEIDVLEPTGGADENEFGRALALTETTVVVGAAFDGPGYVYVFERDDGGTASPLDDAWTQTARLEASDGVDSDQFGEAVAIHGDVVAVGAEDHYGAGVPIAGAAYVFERDDAGTPLDRLDDTWVERDKLVASNAGFGHHLGHAIAVNGDTVLVGTWSGNRAYAFVRSREGTPGDPTDDRWLQRGQLVGPAGAVGDRRFGAAVALSEETALIGDYSGDGFGIDDGTAYVYHRDDNRTPFQLDDRWILTAELGGDDPHANSYGFSLALDGTTAFVGDFLDDEGGFETGAVHVFGVPEALPLRADPPAVSALGGGSQSLRFETGPCFPREAYIVLGTTSGTSPGTTLGGAAIPLEEDAYYKATLTQPNHPPLANSLGHLTRWGTGRAEFTLTPGVDPSTVGTVVHHALVVFDALTGTARLVSAPVRLEILP